MTMLARLTEVMRCARMRGDWDDEAVVLELLAEMRNLDWELAAAPERILCRIADKAEHEGAYMGGYDHLENASIAIWEKTIDAIRAEATESAQTSEPERE